MFSKSRYRDASRRLRTTDLVDTLEANAPDEKLPYNGKDKAYKLGRQMPRQVNGRREEDAWTRSHQMTKPRCQDHKP